MSDQPVSATGAASAPASATPVTTPGAPAQTPRKPLGSLAMVWAFARRYPVQIIAALIGLTLSSTATLAIPWGFRRIIDQAFATGNTANI
ncbi:MAG: hypothetical protein ACKOUM_10680, partial [Sphingopyxis sp.]